MNFKDAPIQRKLTTIILLTSGVAVLLACAAFTAYETLIFRKTLLSEVQMMADVISANSVAALTFNDKKTATETLSTLQANRNILRGGLYDAEGRLFAHFPADANQASFPKKTSVGYDFDFAGGQLVLFYPVISKDENALGVLYLQTDLTPLYERVRLYLGIVVLVMVASTLVTLGLARWLQRSITYPITELAETARAISEQKNYLVRADKQGHDEIGRLTEAFNHMLAQIHERDLALLAQQERLRLALDASQTGTWDWDIKTNRLVWDDFTHLLFGLKPGTFGGDYESFINLIHPQDRMAVSAAVEATLANGKEFNVEFQVLWPDGQLHQIASRGKAVGAEGQKAVRMSGVCLDITERKRQEEEIRLLNLELEQRVLLRTAELTASIREMETFTYSVSHDLRAPLRHIIAFTEILQEECAQSLETNAQEYLQRIVHGARNMSQLVDALLNLARIGRQGLNLQPTHLNSLVREIVQELIPETAPRRIDWKISLLPEIQCDPGLMRQVFVNLLANAIKYTRTREIAVIEVGVTVVHGETAVFVRDNGVGFNMKYADKLFGVFQRLHRAEDFEGTGVGLATVERILHKHGGRVWAESAVGAGATFYFTIAFNRAHAPPSPDTNIFIGNIRHK